MLEVFLYVHNCGVLHRAVKRSRQVELVSRRPGTYFAGSRAHFRWERSLVNWILERGSEHRTTLIIAGSPFDSFIPSGPRIEWYIATPCGVRDRFQPLCFFVVCFHCFRILIRVLWVACDPSFAKNVYSIIANGCAFCTFSAGGLGNYTCRKDTSNRATDL